VKRIPIALVALTLVAGACGDDSATVDTSVATTTTAPTSTSASPTSTAAATTPPAANGTWFDTLEAGACFDDVWDGDNFDFSVPPALVPCDGNHDNEVVAFVQLPDGEYPGEDALIPEVDDACAMSYDEFFGGSPRATDFMFTWNVFPDAADWDAGSRMAVCITYGGEPVAGTARSAGLTAPGETLAVLHEIDGQLDVWTLDGGTGELLVNVSDDPASIQTSPPGWTPTGNAVLWSSGDSEPGRRIFAAPVGGNPQGLLGGLDVESVGSPAVRPLESPNPVIAVIAAPGGGEFDVFVYDGDTDVLTNLTVDNTDRDTTPNWSPDGTKIAYRARHDGNSDVWVMDADGSNKTRLTSDPGFDGDPRWSPDGTRLLFTSDRTGDYEIWIMDADGSSQRNLTNHPAADEYPTWSPDGSLIAFHSSRHGGISLWIMNADGSDQSNLSWDAPVGYPSFQPRGE